MERDPAEVWDAACGMLQGALSATASASCAPAYTIERYEAGTVVLAAATPELAASIDGGWGDSIARKLGVVLRRPVRVRVLSPDDPDDARAEAPTRSTSAPWTRPQGTGVRSGPVTPPRIPVFMLPECRMTSTQVWMSVLDELRGSGAIPKPEIESWLRDSVLVGRDDDGALIVGVPHALAERRAGRFLSAIETAAMHIVGFDCEIRVVRTSTWLAGGGATGTRWIT